MKRFSLVSLVLLMLALVVVLCACGGDEPEDTTLPPTTSVPATSAPATSAPAASEPTSATVTTTAPATTAPATSAPATSAPAVTTAPITATQNPIKGVKIMDSFDRKHPNELRLTYTDNTRQYVEQSLGIRAGFNSLTYTHSLDRKSVV